MMDSWIPTRTHTHSCLHSCLFKMKVHVGSGYIDKTEAGYFSLYNFKLKLYITVIFQKCYFVSFAKVFLFNRIILE